MLSLAILSVALIFIGLSVNVPGFVMSPASLCGTLLACSFIFFIVFAIVSQFKGFSHPGD